MGDAATRVRILVEGRPEDCRVAILENGSLAEYIPSHHDGDATAVGDIYLGRVTKLAPGVEAAFVDIGTDTDAFLPALEWPAGGLSPGQRLMVQVQKDPVGEKGARVSARLALAGRYLVYLPGGEKVRISKRIPAEDERSRLLAVGEEILPEKTGLILRTAAAGESKEDLARDVASMAELWGKIQAKARTLEPPRLVFQEPGPAARVVRDFLTPEVEAVVAASEALAREIRAASFLVPPELLGRVRVEEEPFVAAGVERELARALGPRVGLRSGGHLMIEPTEALVSIDVNSGSSRGGPDLEATALATNLEAVETVARQLRLRDLGGIIVIDFIDLSDPLHQKQVQDALEAAFRRDRANPKIHGWTELGLVLVSRRRRRMPLFRALTRECEGCKGLGRVDAPGRVVERAAAACKALLAKDPDRAVRLRLHPDLIPPARAELLERLEAVEIKGDRNLAPHAFAVESGPPRVRPPRESDEDPDEDALPGS